MTEPGTVVPFPTLPPPPTDLGEYLTFFAADMPDCGFDRDGHLILKLKVHPEDKYRAMPLTDIKGRRFNVTIHSPRGNRPLVAANSQLKVYGAAERSKQRRAERRWERTRAAFEGEPDDVA